MKIKVGQAAYAKVARVEDVYVTTAQANGRRSLKITVQDRPGNTAQTSWQN